MKVIIATLGNRDAHIKTLLRSERADKLILIAGKPAKDIPGMEVIEEKKEINPIEIAENMKSDYSSDHLDVEIERVNAFDFDECLNSMIDILRKESKNRRIIGITGGTKLLSGAAICACWIEGVEAFYVLEKPEEIISLPVPGPGYYKGLEKEEKKVLIALMDGKKATTVIGEIADVSTGKVSNSLSELEGYRMVKGEMGKIKPEGYDGGIYRKAKVWSLTPVGKFYARIAKEELGAGRSEK
jgi:CRISPR locus-related DNA-binding protein